jgi:hypothetical protein
MSVDFNDKSTWANGLSDSDAINLGIWALNTLAHPDASTDQQFEVADHFQERAVEVLDGLRERLERLEPENFEAWVVEFVYNTDPDGKPVDEDDWSNRTLHGPFATEEDAHMWAGEQPEDEDVKEELVYKLNDPADRANTD